MRQKGSIALQAEERCEITDIINPSANLDTKKQGDWNDYRHLSRLLNSQEEGGDSRSENSDSDCSRSAGLDNTTSDGCGGDQSHMVSSMLNSNKRTLSFGVMDELMLLPGNKRVHYWSSSSCGQLSPSESDSLEDQAFPDFFL